MSHQVHTHVLDSHDVAEIVESYDAESVEEGLKIWAYNQYPIAHVSYFSLSDIRVKEDGNELVEATVEVTER